MSELKAESPTSPPPKSEQETSESPTSPPPKAEQETSEYPTSPPPSIQLHSNSGTPVSIAYKLRHRGFNKVLKTTDILSEIVLWRRKQLNVGILVAATATWIVMDVYHYSFITLLSWVAIALLSCLFFWGSIHRFLKKYNLTIFLLFN